MKLSVLFDSAAAAGFSGVMVYAENGKQKLSKVSGFRYFETGKKLRKTDIFELASVSKQFTAMIVMMLKERGKLGFDDSVSMYLSVPYKGITIRHLLTHTSGLPDYQEMMDTYWDKSNVAGNKEIIDYLIRYAPPSKFSPGEKYDYSNTGYVLLASIAEKASGEDFVSLCRQWIFSPLRMRQTDIRTLEEKARVRKFAAGHLLDDSGKYINANRLHASDYTVWLGNRKGPGRVSSTAKDLLKWDNALYGEILVQKNTIDEAYRPMKLNDGSFSQYGFGWELKKNYKNDHIVSHNGDNPGYKTTIVRNLDQRSTLIILNNNAHKTFDNLSLFMK